MPLINSAIQTNKKSENRGFNDVYPRSEQYVHLSNKYRAAGNYKRLNEISDEYNNNKKCTCNPAKRFKRADDGMVLNSCNCGAHKE